MRTVRLNEYQLAQAARGRLPGFSEAVRAMSTIDGSTIVCPAECWHALAWQYAPRPASAPPPEPTTAELAANFTGAVARWVSAGAPVVSRLSYEVRAATCAACPQWEPQARFGLGRCNAPGCGCTSLKRWLATEKCPLGKWPERADL